MFLATGLVAGVLALASSEIPSAAAPLASCSVTTVTGLGSSATTASGTAYVVLPSGGSALIQLDTVSNHQWNLSWDLTQTSGGSKKYHGANTYGSYYDGRVTARSQEWVVSNTPGGTYHLASWLTWRSASGTKPVFWSVTVYATSASSPDACRPIGPMELVGFNTALRGGCLHGQAADPVDTETGNFHEPFTAISVPGRGPGLEFSFAYNSLNAGTGRGLGKGWSWNYGMYVRFDASRRTVVQENGAEVGFSPGPGGTWIAPGRFDASLVQQPDGTWLFVRNQFERFTFDATGRLTSLSGQNGYPTTLSYDSSGLLQTATDDAGRTLTFSWANGRITQVTDGALPPRSVTLGYDTAADELDVYEDVAGGTWLFGYDAAHRMTSMTDPLQATEQVPAPVINVYDHQGKVVSQTDRLGGSWVFDYGAVPGSTKVTSPGGEVTLDRYVAGRRTEHILGYGSAAPSVSKFEYDPLSYQVTRFEDPNGSVTTAEYDSEGNCVEVDGPEGTTTKTHNAAGQVLTATGPDQVTTTFTYDANGNPTSISRPLTGSNPPASRTVILDYDPARPGDLTSLTDERGKAWSYSYDPVSGDLLSSTDPEGGKTTAAYNTLGWMTSTVDARGNALGANPDDHRTVFTYTDHGDVATITSPDGDVTTIGYDKNRNVTSVTEPGSPSESTTYDPEERPVVTLRPDGTTTGTTYWPDGQVQSQTAPGGAVTSYTLDSHGRIETSTDPAGRVTTTSYDAGGRVVAVEQPGGSCEAVPKVGCVSYEYFDTGLLKQLDYSDPATDDVDFTYDNIGQIATTTVGGSTTTWVRDSLGRVVSVSEPGGVTVGYGYADLGDQATTITYPGNKTLVRTFDDAGRLETSTGWTGGTATYGYDPASNLTTIDNPSTTGVEDTFGYDDDNDLVASTVNQGATQLAALGYSRNAKSLVAAYTGSGLPGSTDTFTYNALDMVATDSAGSYTYDAAGNLTQQPGGSKQRFNVANELCYASVTSTANECAAPPSDATRYNYDGRGNRTLERPANRVPTAFTYDQANRLSSATVPAFPNGTGQYHSLPTGQVWLSAGETVGSGATRTYQITGANGIPSNGVESVVLRLHSAAATTYGALTAHPTGTAPGNTVGLYFNPGETASNLTIAKINQSSGRVTITVNVPAGHSTAMSIELVGWHGSANAPGGLTFEPVAPVRALSQGMSVGQEEPIDVTGAHGIPSTGVAAVAVVAHSVNAGSTGYFTVYGGPTRPGTVSLLYDAGHASALTVVPVGADGDIKLYSTGATTAAVDIVGYYTTVQSGAGNLAHTIDPAYVADTVNHTGVCDGGTCNRLPATTLMTIKVAGVGGVPSGATAVAVVMQVVTPSAAGFLTAYATGQAMPMTATTVFDDVFTSATAVIPVGTDGTITVASSAAVDLLVQAVGYFDPASKTYNYTYSGDGLRSTKVAPDGTVTRFTWDRTQAIPVLLVEDIDAPGTANDKTIRYLYGPNGTVTSDITTPAVGGETIRWYHHDQLGSTRLLTSSDGTPVGTAAYRPYGQPVPGAITGLTTSIGWAGEYRDAETGLIYLRARYYDPTTGQFLTRDPLESVTREPYGYTGNNPINRTDSTGMDWWDPRDNILPALGEAAQDTGEFIYRNRGTIATVGAVGTCLVPGWGLAACGYATAGAFAARAEQRIDERGFSNSLRANLLDGGLTYLTFGVGGAFEQVVGPWAGFTRYGNTVGALGRWRFDHFGRLIPAGYDFTNLFGWIDELC